MDRFSRRAALATLGTSLTGLAGCNSLDVSNPLSGTVEVEWIAVSPPHYDMPGPTAGVVSNVDVLFVNPGSAAAEEEIEVEIDGETVETLAVSVEGDDHVERTVEYTFEDTGSFEVSAGDVTEQIHVTDEIDLQVTRQARGQFVARPEGTRGVVTALISGRNESDFTVPYEPTVEIDGEPVEDLSYPDTLPRTPSEEFDGELEPNERVALIAHREVEVGEEYEVTVDGETIASVSLDPQDSSFRYGQPDRAGPAIPRDGIGREPELVERFAIDPPSNLGEIGLAEVTELRDMVTLAVTDDHVYVRSRWNAFDEEDKKVRFPLLGAYDRWTGEEEWVTIGSSPAEVGVVDGVEYVLLGHELYAGTPETEELWSTEVYTEPYGSMDETMLVPTADAIYVGTPDGVRVVDPDSGDIRRTLEGTYAAVSDGHIFTWDRTRLRRYETGSTDPVWTTELEREDTGLTITIGRDEGVHAFTEHGLVHDGRVVLTSYVEDGMNTRCLAHVFDDENGEEKRRLHLVEAGSVTGERASGPAGSITDFGGQTQMVLLPDITQPVVQNGYLNVGTTYGLARYDLDDGNGGTLDIGGGYPTIASGSTIYTELDDGLYVSSVTGDPQGREPEPDLEIPTGTEFNTVGFDISFGRDSLYLLSDGYVNVIGGTLPEGGADEGGESSGSVDDGSAGNEGDESNGGKDGANDPSDDEERDDRNSEDAVTIRVGPESSESHFEPQDVQVDVGTTVVWEWAGGSEEHQIDLPLDGRVSEVTNETGHTFEVTFDTAGPMPYVCAEHGENGMVEIVE